MASIREFIERQVTSEIRERHICPNCERPLRDALITFDYPASEPAIGVPRTMVLRWCCGVCEHGERHEREIREAVRQEITAAYQRSAQPIGADDVLDVRAALAQLEVGFREVFGAA